MRKSYVKDLLQSPGTTQTQPSHLDALTSSSPLSTNVTQFPSIAHKEPGDELTTAAPLTAVPGFSPAPLSDAVNFSSFNASPTSSVSFSPPEAVPLPESSFPIPLTSANSMLQADLLPPTELSFLGQSQWHTDSRLPEEATIVAPVEAGKIESDVATFGHIIPAGTQTAPLAFSEDVLELSDVLVSDLGGSDSNTIAPTLPSLSQEIPLLAVLGSSSPYQEETSNSFDSITTTQPSNVGGSYDLAVGQVTSPIHTQLNTEPTVNQDVSLGTVNTFDNVTTHQMPEALIEEIVNRVIQRLSTNAIQEIAWEVVPEMAELLIRKQIAQQKQLSH